MIVSLALKHMWIYVLTASRRMNPLARITPYMDFPKNVFFSMLFSNPSLATALWHRCVIHTD